MNFLLLLDYDGTLTPIKNHPKLALLSSKRRMFLQKLANHPKIKIAIISGRKLSDLEQMVKIPGIIYVGNHGFEIKTGEKSRVLPAAKKNIPILKQIKSLLADNIKIKGAWIEDKGLTLSVHYRLVAPDKLKEFNKLFSAAIGSWQKKIKITKGKNVFDIRPLFDWDKGKAVKWIIKNLKLENYWPVYIGDDKTDEDAFRVLREKGVTIHVGKAKTLAKARLKNISGVYRYLRGLILDES